MSFFPRALQPFALLIFLALGQPRGVSGEGDSAPIPVPTASQRGAFLRTEFARLDLNRNGTIDRDEFAEQRDSVIRWAKATAKEKGFRPEHVSALYAAPLLDGRPVYPRFEDVDTNRDGRVTFFDEFIGFSAADFACFVAWDANADGRVTRGEFSRAEAKLKHSYRIDVTLPVAPGVSAKQLGFRFDLVDRDGDGQWTWHDLVAFSKTLPPLNHEGVHAVASFLQADRDGDRRVSENESIAWAVSIGEEELIRLAKSVFKLRDANRDGGIDPDEFFSTGENPGRQFVGLDKNADGRLVFDEVAGMDWVAGKDVRRDRAYFARCDKNGDKAVSWQEYCDINTRDVAFGALDHLDINNRISIREWNAVEEEFLAAAAGKVVPAQGPASYARLWFPGIFTLVKFKDVDQNRDLEISWLEFSRFPFAVDEGEK